MHICIYIYIYRFLYILTSKFIYICICVYIYICKYRYIERPLLLDGYKFDLRLYVTVTSMNPLEAFIYREGFTRLSSEPYRYIGHT